MWKDQLWPRTSYPTPFSHEATALVSSTAIALSADKWGTIKENSASAQVTGWTLKGVNRNNSDTSRNTNVLTLYWKLTNSVTTRTITLYKDIQMTQSVATGTRTGDGSITLAEANSSGITGTVTVAYTIDDTDTSNQLIIGPRATYAKITVDSQPIRYWTDNTVPTASDGLYAAAASIVELNSSEEIMNFRMIRQGASDANVSVAYYEAVT